VAVNIKVRLNKQIVVPVRFVRAVTGAPVIDAPDIDDRGFAMGTRPGTWGASDARGAMAGIASGDTVRIKVLREDIDAGAPLFITSTDTSIVDVQAPAGGGPVPADGVFSIRGVTDVVRHPVKVQARLGSATGPVLGEFEPHIFQLRRLPVHAHLCRINGNITTRTAQSLVAVFQQVNDVWRTAGIEWVYNPAQTVETPINGLANAGQMTTNLSGTPPEFREFTTIINTAFDRTRSSVDIYFVQLANEVTGLTFSNSNARPPAGGGFGVVIADSGTFQTIAHELCHFLNVPEHVDLDAAGNQFRTDIWSLRALMFSSLGFGPQNPPHRNDVGYGANQAGAFIQIKDLAADRTDAELSRARTRSLNPF